MKCPVCDKEMVFMSKYCKYGNHNHHGEVNEIYHCYNHDGGAVYLHLKWQEYTKEELDYE